MLVLGSTLGDHIGEDIAITGYVQECLEREIVIRTTDDETVRIKLNSNDEINNLEGLVQALGKCTSSNTVICDILVKFNDEANVDFKKQAYNEMVGFVQKMNA